MLLMYIVLYLLIICRVTHHDKMTVDSGGGGQGDGGDTMTESETHEKEMRARLIHYHNSFSSQGRVSPHALCSDFFVYVVHTGWLVNLFPVRQ